MPGWLRGGSDAEDVTCALMNLPSRRITHKARAAHAGAPGAHHRSLAADGDDDDDDEEASDSQNPAGGTIQFCL